MSSAPTSSVCLSVTRAAVQFYGETLGIERNPRAHQNWPEFETSNVTLGMMVPGQIGREFVPNPWPIALRVPDVAEARERLEKTGVEFTGETLDTGLCHMAFFSTPTGTH
jgi:predicted enzyme related to lactoylglutathione lyase